LIKKIASAMILTLLLVSILTLAFNTQPVKASGTIYIRADGSIDPPTANITTTDNVTYTFTGNINDSIVVERNNIIINGADYILQGTGSETGIYLSGRSNVTIKNMAINLCGYGVNLGSTSYCIISGNNITNNGIGVELRWSDNNTFYGNDIANNNVGFELYHSDSNILSGNNIRNHDYGVDLRLSYKNKFCHNNFINNTNQIYFHLGSCENIWDDGYPSGGNYWSDYAGTDLCRGSYQNETGGDGIGDTPYVIDENNQDNYPLMIPYAGSVRNLNTGQSYPTIQKGINNASQNDRILVLSGTYYENVVVNKTICLIGEDKGTTVIDGVQKGHVINVVADNVTISDFTIANSSLESSGSGIYLYGINGCNITQNNIVDNNIGVFLAWASNNNISGNNVAENSWCGIYLSYSSNNNVISLNNLEANNWYGIGLLHSSNINDIHGNNITRNYYGIGLGSFSSYNVIFGNDIANNHIGIGLFEFSTNNVISGNNITANNQYGIYFNDASNNEFFHNNLVNNAQQVWQYGSGYVNFWDNGCEGNYWSDYNGTDSDGDGIGDTPYVIDGDNTDRYPLMNPYWLPGDVNHDLKINIYDVVRITGVYGSQQGDPNWNCHSDIAEPYGIINIYDVVTCTKDYRKEYTP